MMMLSRTITNYTELILMYTIATIYDSRCQSVTKNWNNTEILENSLCCKSNKLDNNDDKVLTRSLFDQIKEGVLNLGWEKQ